MSSIGRQIGPYRLLRLIGAGAMGEVYEAEHATLEVRHAVKILSEPFAAHATAVERFLREARHAARLTHAHIVPVYNADRADGLCFLAMQLIRGRSLGTIVAQEGPLLVQRAARYVHQIAQALQCAHNAGLMHRDVKPDNVLIDEHDVARLTDFGLVREQLDPARSDHGRANPDGSSAASPNMSIVGTPFYMSPEQWSGRNVDPRSDLFALGVSWYFLITGQWPWPGEDPREVFHSMRSMPPVPIDVHGVPVDRHTAELVHRAIERDPDQRFQTAEEMIAAIDAWWVQNISTSPLPRAEGSYVGVSSRPSASSAGSSNFATQIHGVGSSAGAPTVASGDTEASRLLEEINALKQSIARKPQRSTTPTFALLTAGFVVAVALAWIYFAGAFGPASSPPDQPRGPLWAWDLPPEAATPEQPLIVRSATYALPLKLDADLLVNGQPHPVDRPLPLAEGLNLFQLTARRGDASAQRTLAVLRDSVPPTLQLRAPQLNDVLFISPEPLLVIEALATDDSALDYVLLEVSGQPEVRLEPETETEPEGLIRAKLPLSDDLLTMRLVAVDRAGNRSAPVSFAARHDREPLLLAWKDASADAQATGRVWSAGSSVVLQGTVNKPAAALTPGTGQLELEPDGSWVLRLDLPPGSHAVRIEATDPSGRQASLSRTVIVDPNPPAVLDLNPPADAVIEQLGHSEPIILTGRLDVPESTLLRDGQPVHVDDQGRFRITLTPGGFGPMPVSLTARKPTGLTTQIVHRLVIREQRYILRGTNKAGAEEYTRIKDEAVVVRIPAGEYPQGHPSLPNAPERTVRLDSFYIDKFEVTNRQFASFLNDRALAPEEVFARLLPEKDKAAQLTAIEHDGQRWRARSGEEKFPVTGITWQAARDYAAWVDPDAGTLPSEAQFEAAARGTDKRILPWGTKTAFGEVNFRNAGMGDKPAAVDFLGDKGLSPFGVSGLAGNVEEWLLDWYDETSYAQLAGEANPALIQRPYVQDIPRRAVRGGSAVSSFRTIDDELRRATEPNPHRLDLPTSLIPAIRGARAPNETALDRGFRVAAPVHP